MLLEYTAASYVWSNHAVHAPSLHVATIAMSRLQHRLIQHARSSWSGFIGTCGKLALARIIKVCTAIRFCVATDGLLTHH